jgi:hypothetical protein
LTEWTNESFTHAKINDKLFYKGEYYMKKFHEWLQIKEDTCPKCKKHFKTKGEEGEHPCSFGCEPPECSKCGAKINPKKDEECPKCGEPLGKAGHSYGD